MPKNYCRTNPVLRNMCKEPLTSSDTYDANLIIIDSDSSQDQFILIFDDQIKQSKLDNMA